MISRKDEQSKLRVVGLCISDNGTRIERRKECFVVSDTELQQGGLNSTGHNDLQQSRHALTCIMVILDTTYL